MGSQRLCPRAAWAALRQKILRWCGAGENGEGLRQACDLTSLGAHLAAQPSGLFPAPVAARREVHSDHQQGRHGQRRSPPRQPARTAFFRTYRSQYAASKLGRGLRLRRRSTHQRSGFECALHARHTNLALSLQVSANLATLRFFGDVQGVKLIMLAEFFAVHDATTPSSSRRLCNAVRTQVLIVPSGCPIWTAISDCDNPSKYASSITAR